MDYENVKGKPLTKEESKFLLELIESSRIITTKTTNATNNKLKTEEWIRLAERFNATATNCPRTPQQLRLKWENLKKNSRKRSTKIRMNQIKTGGGPADYIPPDDILDRVTALLGSTGSGFTVPFGGDRETAGIDIGVGDCDDDGEGDIRVAVVECTDDPLVLETIGCGGGGSGVDTECSLLHVIDQNVITPNKPKKLTFNTPRAGRKKNKFDENRSARNIAIAEYYAAKKQCLDAKLKFINLESELCKLRTIEIKINNEKKLLETEKLKIELKKLKDL